MASQGILPPDIARDAVLRGNEYGWTISSFPEALARAKSSAYACLGGQFQFRLNDAICEMYWLNADSRNRDEGELWAAYSRRSCEEVLSGFQRLISETDFGKEARAWPSVQIDPAKDLFFVAYFETENDWTSFRLR